LASALQLAYRGAIVFRDLLNILDRFRPRERFIDEVAIEFLQDHEPEEAYHQARQLMRLARDQHDRAMEKLHARVAALTGRRIGGKDTGEELYGQPTRMIDGGRTTRI
jgi:hypothetical protein